MCHKGIEYLIVADDHRCVRRSTPHLGTVGDHANDIFAFDDGGPRNDIANQNNALTAKAGDDDPRFVSVH